MSGILNGRRRLARGGGCVAIIMGSLLVGVSCHRPAPPSAPTTTTQAAPVRAWAEKLDQPGLPNLHRVSDDLYRGAQPTAEGFRQLKAMGVKTVLNLRSLHSDRDLLGDTGLAYEEIDMKAWHAEDEDVVKFLKIVTDKDRLPLFVHCQHGADRTGTMCAVYRVVVQDWDKDEAIREMTQGGFGFHETWQNLVRYMKDLDVEAVKKKAGVQ